MGRDLARPQCRPRPAVSIHAPAWGATDWAAHERQSLQVSIHAPAWGATSAASLASKGLYVSIHAPAWGATFAAGPSGLSPYCFNPRARVGRDRFMVLFLVLPVLSFNPRARVGRDRLFGVSRQTVSSFNPRARVGRDVPLLIANCIIYDVSIHAPAWGATYRYDYVSIGLAFQSTRPRGARLFRFLTYFYDLKFQSTRPRGARH